MSGIVVAVVGSTAIGLYSSEQSRLQAKKQHKQTMQVQADAEADAKAYDLAAGQDIKDSETATTTYGGDKLKKKKLTANDLLVRPTGSTSEGSLGLGFDY